MKTDNLNGGAVHLLIGLATAPVVACGFLVLGVLPKDGLVIIDERYLRKLRYSTKPNEVTCCDCRRVMARNADFKMEVNNGCK